MTIRIDNPTTARVDGHDAVVFWDTCAWVAYCIQHDIAAQGQSREHAVRRLGSTIADERAWAEHYTGSDSLDRLGPPPAHILEAFERAKATEAA